MSPAIIRISTEISNVLGPTAAPPLSLCHPVLPEELMCLQDLLNTVGTLCCVQLFSFASRQCDNHEHSAQVLSKGAIAEIVPGSG